MLLFFIYISLCHWLYFLTGAHARTHTHTPLSEKKHREEKKGKELKERDTVKSTKKGNEERREEGRKGEGKRIGRREKREKKGEKKKYGR